MRRQEAIAALRSPELKRDFGVGRIALFGLRRATRGAKTVTWISWFTSRLVRLFDSFIGLKLFREDHLGPAFTPTTSSKRAGKFGDSHQDELRRNYGRRPDAVAGQAFAALAALSPSACADAPEGSRINTAVPSANRELDSPAPDVLALAMA